MSARPSPGGGNQPVFLPVNLNVRIVLMPNSRVSGAVGLRVRWQCVDEAAERRAHDADAQGLLPSLSKYIST